MRHDPKADFGEKVPIRLKRLTPIKMHDLKRTMDVLTAIEKDLQELHKRIDGIENMLRKMSDDEAA